VPGTPESDVRAHHQLPSFVSVGTFTDQLISARASTQTADVPLISAAIQTDGPRITPAQPKARALLTTLLGGDVSAIENFHSLSTELLLDAALPLATQATRAASDYKAMLRSLEDHRDVLHRRLFPPVSAGAPLGSDSGFDNQSPNETISPGSTVPLDSQQLQSPSTSEAAARLEFVVLKQQKQLAQLAAERNSLLLQLEQTSLDPGVQALMTTRAEVASLRAALCRAVDEKDQLSAAASNSQSPSAVAALQQSLATERRRAAKAEATVEELQTHNAETAQELVRLQAAITDAEETSRTSAELHFAELASFSRIAAQARDQALKAVCSDDNALAVARGIVAQVGQLELAHSAAQRSLGQLRAAVESRDRTIANLEQALSPSVPLQQRLKELQSQLAAARGIASFTHAEQQAERIKCLETQIANHARQNSQLQNALARALTLYRGLGDPQSHSTAEANSLRVLDVLLDRAETRRREQEARADAAERQRDELLSRIRQMM
jgi:hypothetical protein